MNRNREAALGLLRGEAEEKELLTGGDLKNRYALCLNGSLVSEPFLVSRLFPRFD